MRNVQLFGTILLISSGCILASPGHRRAAVAGHWGSDTISTEPKEQPDNAETVVINDQSEPSKEVRNNPVNNFPETEPSSDQNIDKPPIQAVTEEENEDANKNSEDAAADDVVTESVVTESIVTEEVDTPFPNVGKIQDIIEAGNSAMLGKVDLKNVGKENVLIAREKDGDYHIHIRVPADKANLPEVIEPEMGPTTDGPGEETDETDIPGDEDSDSVTDSTASETTSKSITSPDSKSSTQAIPARNWGSDSSENENSNVHSAETTGKPSTSNGNNALGNVGLWGGTTTSKSETTGAKSETTGGSSTSGGSTTKQETTKQETTKPETTKPDSAQDTIKSETTGPKSTSQQPALNWGKDSDDTEENVPDKGKAAPDNNESKPEVMAAPEQQEEAESTSWFRYNDGTLNYLAILAVMFFLFI